MSRRVISGEVLTGGEGWGKGEGRQYLYTVATRIISALIWAALRAILMFR